MVLQHHERLDGSGYPNGLKGNSIALEARILALADVVEAISSHKPCRPGPGTGIAMRELQQKRGIHFDAEVVDKCIALFKDKRFTFDS